MYKYILLLLFTFFQTEIYSEEREVQSCKPPWDVYTLTECAINMHPSYKLELYRTKEMQGRKKIAEYFFPSNPIVGGSIASRRGSVDSTNLSGGGSFNQATNFQLLVSQEIFVGGKREKAMQIADEEFRSQIFRLETIRRSIYFSSLSNLVRFQNAKKEELLSQELYQLSQKLTTIARARVKEGISPGIDESLSESEELRMAKVWKNSIRKAEQTKGELNLLLSQSQNMEMDWNPTFNLYLELSDDKDSLLSLALENRPEIKLTEKDIKLAMLRYEEVRLQKVSNISVGAFVQNDGFNERVIGGQISLPLVVWRDFEGESLIARSKSEQSFETRDLVSRTVKQEVIQALSNYLTLKEELAFYDQRLLDRTSNDISNLTEALRMGKIRVIDAINNQRILVQTKLNYLQTKSDFELAQIELIRALGLPEGKLVIRDKL